LRLVGDITGFRTAKKPVLHIKFMDIGVIYSTTPIIPSMTLKIANRIARRTIIWG
jgi:hypothetical protein